MKIKSFTIIGLLTILLFSGCSLQSKVSTDTQANKQQSIKLSQDEQSFLKSTLFQISEASTQKKVFDLLGNPSRSVLDAKYIWEKNIGQYNQRIVVYFKSDKAYELRFDGGPGRFYYVKDLKSGKETIERF